jgi:hypothetical protein
VVSAQGIIPSAMTQISRYADASGGGNAFRAKRAAVVLSCHLLSLVDCCAGRAGQRVAIERELFHIPISGIVM